MPNHAIRTSVSLLKIPLKVAFKHASAERTEGESLWVTVQRGPHVGRGEGCPRLYVTGETLEGAQRWCSEKLDQISAHNPPNFSAFKDIAQQWKESIAQNPAAWCAIELAFLELFSLEENCSLCDLFGIQALPVSHYSAVVSDGEPGRVKEHIQTYLRLGFKDFKFKLSGKVTEDLARYRLFLDLTQKAQSSWKLFPTRMITTCFGRAHVPYTVRFDGNNVWAQHPHLAKAFMEQVQSPMVIGIEEPLGARDFKGLSELSTSVGCAIILDESLTGEDDLRTACALPGTWIPNIRVSKVGGIARSLEIVTLAKRGGTRIIVGAQVGETSLLTRAAHVVASAAEGLLWAQEGAFGERLLQKDPIQPPIQFGWGGRLVW